MLCLNRYGNSHGGAHPFPHKMRYSLQAWPVCCLSVHHHKLSYDVEEWYSGIIASSKDISRVVSRCYQQFFWYRYFAGIRFNWAVGISVGITSLAGTPFFRKRGGWLYQKGAGAPFFLQIGG